MGTDRQVVDDESSRGMASWPSSASMCGTEPVFYRRDQKGTGFSDAFWTSKGISTLRVKFLRTPDDLCSMVLQTAKIWTDFTNGKLSFVSSEDDDAEIRVAFIGGLTSISAIGTNAAFVERGLPTMRLALAPLSNPDELNRIVLHEFGHALGLGHEHQSPSANGQIPWRITPPGVYEYFADNLQWDRPTVEDQVLRPYSRAYTSFSAFDRHSIMIYPIPQEILETGPGIGWNNTLSETDKEFIASIYK